MAATSNPPRLTVVGMGPVLLGALSWLKERGRCDVFAVSQLPLPELDPQLQASVAASGQLLVLEEHAARGGLGEHLSTLLAKTGTPFKLHHHHAQGYPTGRYGSQAFHQQQSGLDFPSIQASVTRLTD